MPVQLKIYPNPVVNLLHIPYSNSTPQIRLLSSDGKDIPIVIKSDTEGELVIDVPNFKWYL